ncbi:pyridoxal 5'-phosphate synthase glutaminase subunit PdxT [Clostridium felsineum]|uniref:pyridoxal 5'-phosphate synthase glutaminase subunit PdxT n=1 Tax=Clostridium felsineum TaxID=36839 RepID=UPI00214D93C7|nr:pyridoxal 5'-phosphate synthase glutaminase subunit PdxT [Clostridium felsineum]MCR3758769.1 pyridoxal 5'-phosphate synthase glutaminase subunit PdxT [Clostridium felsineum]
MRVGVLAFQGGVTEHISHIERLGVKAVKVKSVEDLKRIDRLIIPGGESTTIGRFLMLSNMIDYLKEEIYSGMPVWGTCAGMILLAKEIEDSNISYIKAIDITVRRNAYGSQIDSFTTRACIEEVSLNEIPLVFIRAPYITHIGENVKSLCNIKGNIVAAKSRNVIVTAFHPELTDNLEFHEYFIKI